MKRKIISLSLSLMLVSTHASAAETAGKTEPQTFQIQTRFIDVSNIHWAYDAIKWAIDNDITDGYPDQTFKPDQNVTQSEFLAMLLKAYKVTVTKSTQNEAWDTYYLQFARDKKWTLVDDTHNPINRGQVAKLLANAAGKNYDIKDSIHYLLDSRLSNGKTEKSIAGYKENDLLTRAEAIAFIQNVSNKLNILNVAPTIEEQYSNPNSDILIETSGRIVLLQDIKLTNDRMILDYRKQLQPFEVNGKTYYPKENDLFGASAWVANFQLNGNYKTFNAMLAVDGNYQYDALRFTVYADRKFSKPLYSEVMAKGENPKTIRLKLDGVQTLSMRTTVLTKVGDKYEQIAGYIGSQYTPKERDESIHLYDMTLNEVDK